MRTTSNRGYARLQHLVMAIACAAILAATFAPGAGAVLFAQHALPKEDGPAVGVFGWPGGLIAYGTGFTATLDIATKPSVSITAGPTGAGALAMTLGPDGNLWYIGAGGERTAAGEAETFPQLLTIAPGSASSTLIFQYPSEWVRPTAPLGIATGHEGAMWMADAGGADAVERFAAGAFASFHLPSRGPAISITAGPEDAMWFTDYSGKIGRVGADGEITEFPILDGDTFGSEGFMEPYDIVEGADGALWFTEQATGRIGRMTPAGELREFPIAAKPGGRAPRPRHLVTGPEGNVWFTDPSDDSIGMVTMAGQITEYQIPTGASKSPVVPDRITTGPEGQLWFSEDAVSALGSLDPTASPAVSAAVGRGSPKLAGAGRICRSARESRRRAPGWRARTSTSCVITRNVVRWRTCRKKTTRTAAAQTTRRC